MDNKEKTNQLEPTNPIDIEAKNILDRIATLNGDLPEEINMEELIKLFNANQLKKTMQRISKSNQLLDKVTEQALERFLKNPDEFTNQELLNYMKILQDSINNSQKTLSSQQDQVNKPLIQINQQNITNNDSISKESQEKILNAVEELMKLMNNESNEGIIEGEIQEIIKGDGTNE